MGHTITSLVASTIVCAAMLTPGTGRAADLLAPPVPGEVITEFGAPYVLEDRSLTHRGLDLAARAGAAVAAPAGGTVTFAGLVPGDEGARISAVTIQVAEGLLVTTSPLDAVEVCKDDRVSAGDVLGVVAPAGDGSSPLPHVHLSVRLAGSYVDPRPYLVPVGPAPEEPAARTDAVLAAKRVQAAATAPAAALTGAPAPAAESAAAGVAAPQVAADPAPGALTLHRSALKRAQGTLLAAARLADGSASGLGAGYFAPEVLRAPASVSAPRLALPGVAALSLAVAGAVGFAGWVRDRRMGPAAVRAEH